MKFRTILLLSLGCLFSCLLIASCEDSTSQVAVNERERRDTRRGHADSNESDDRDDDDDDETRKEYSRRLALQSVLRKLRKLPLSRRQLIKLVSRLRNHKKSNKPITKSVLKDIMKEVIATKSTNPGVKVTTITPKPPTTTTTTTTRQPPSTKAPEKYIPSITDGQLVSVQKAPKKPKVVEVPKPPEPTISVKPVAYTPSVFSKPITPMINKPSPIITPHISNPYIPPPKVEPPVVKVQIKPSPPSPAVTTHVKSEVQVVPMSDGSSVAVDTRVTPELKLNIDHIPLHMRTQALFQRLRILRQRLNNFKKLRDRQNAAREPKPEVVQTSLSSVASSSSAKIASEPSQTALKAAAPYTASTSSKSFSLSSPSLQTDVPYITKDKTESILQTQAVGKAHALTGISNLSSSPKSPASITSAEMTQDESSRVKKIILVIQRLASRSGSKKLKVSSKAKDLLIKWVRKYKNAMVPKQISSPKLSVQYSVASGLNTVPVDQVGTKSLQSNIPLSSTAEMANPHMMENDVIKQKIKKSDRDGHKVSSAVIESSKDTYISDSPLAKSHFKSAPKSSLAQDLTSTKSTHETAVESSKSAQASPIPPSSKLENVGKNSLVSEKTFDTPKQIDQTAVISKVKVIHGDSKASGIKKQNLQTPESEFKQALQSNTDMLSQTQEIESVIEEAPKHIFATFLPPVIEDPSLKKSKPFETFEDSETKSVNEGVEISSVQNTPKDKSVPESKATSEISPSISTKFTSPPTVDEKMPNDPHPSVIDLKPSVDNSQFGTIALEAPFVQSNSPQIPSKPETSSFDVKSEPSFAILESIENKMSPASTISSLVKQANTFAEANLDQSPYKKVPSEQISNDVGTFKDHQISNSPELNSESNITPLFQKQTQNTFFKDIQTPTETIPIESKIIKNTELGKEKVPDETPSNLNSLPIFQQVSKNIFSETENTISSRDDNILSKNYENQATGGNNVVSATETSNLIPLQNPDFNTVENKVPTSITQTNAKHASEKLFHPSEPIGSELIPRPMNKNPNIEHSLPGVVIDASFLETHEKTQKPSSKSVEDKLNGFAIILPNESPVQSHENSHTIKTEIIETKPTNVVDINSSLSGKNRNVITSKSLPSMELPPLTLPVPSQSNPPNSPLVTLSRAKQNTKANTQRINVSKNSVPTLHMTQGNLANSQNRASFVISQSSQKPEVDINRFGRTSLDKAAILRKLLEIRRMREQLITTGRINDRRLSDLFPHSRPSLSNPTTISRPQQSASLSQNSVVFWGDNTNPSSLSNPHGTNRAHRRKRSIHNSHHILGNMGPHNQMFTDMPLHSLSYNKKVGNRVDLYGGLGSLSGAHPYLGHGSGDMATAGSLSMGHVHPNVIQDVGMTKLGRFFQKPVHISPTPNIPNIANVVNRIFAPGAMANSPQLFSGNSLSASSVHHSQHKQAFHPNGSIRRPMYGVRKSLVGFPRRQNFVETAPIKLRASNRHGVRISVKNNASPGFHAHQQNLQRIGDKNTIDTSYMENSLSLGAPKTERPTYRTVRRIVILPLPTKMSTVSTNQDLTQTNEIVQKTSQSDIHSSKTGYFKKVQPETKPYDNKNNVKYKTLMSDSKSRGMQHSNSENANINLSAVSTQATHSSQFNKAHSPANASLPVQKDYSHHTKSSYHSGNALSSSPPQHDKMKDSTSFVKFAFSLNSPASIFLNNVESPPTKIEPIQAGYSGSISAAPNSLARAEARKDKAGPVLSATPYIGSQKTSNSGIVFEEIDPLSLTNFILAAGEGLNEGQGEIEMSKAPIRLPDNTVKSGVILDIPEKNDFIGQNTQRERKNYTSPVSPKYPENKINRENLISPATKKAISISNRKGPRPTKRPTTNSGLSQGNQTPFSFSLSGLSMGSHTNSPKTTVPHSVKPTIKPTLKTPMSHRPYNPPSAHQSTTHRVQKQDPNYHYANENTLSKYQHQENIQIQQIDKKSDIIPIAYQYINNSRIQYQIVDNSPSKSLHKTHADFKPSNTPSSRDFVQQASASLSSFKPEKNIPINNIVGQNFEAKDKFSPYPNAMRTGHSTAAHTAKTSPNSRIVVQKPTTPSWHVQNNHNHHNHQKFGVIGHYHKEPIIEIQGNSVSQTKHDQPFKHPNQVYSSSLSSIHHGQSTSHSRTHANSINMENSINGFHASGNTGSPKHSTSNLSASNTMVSRPTNLQKKSSINSGTMVLKQSDSHSNTRKPALNSLGQKNINSLVISGQSNTKTYRIMSGKQSALTTQNMRQSSINDFPMKAKQNIVNHSLHSKNINKLNTIGSQHHARGQTVNRIHPQTRQGQRQQLPQNRVKTSIHPTHLGSSLQTLSKHQGSVSTTQHKDQSTLQEMQLGSPAPRSPKPATPSPIEPATTKIPVFSTGTEQYAISPQLLSMLRNLPMGDLPNFKKRRLERILGVENGQLDASKSGHVSALENVIHEKSIQTGKAGRFEVSAQGLSSSKARYNAPSSYIPENSNTRKNLVDFFTAKKATNYGVPK